jgi:hypothetical protein
MLPEPSPVLDILKLLKHEVGFHEHFPIFVISRPEVQDSLLLGIVDLLNEIICCNALGHDNLLIRHHAIHDGDNCCRHEHKPYERNSTHSLAP